MRCIPPRAAALALLLAAAAWASTDADPLTSLLSVRGEPPQFLEALGSPEELLAVAISPDGTRGAGALKSSQREGRAIIRLVEASDPKPTDLEMPGTVRSLTFGDDSRILYALLHRPAKRREGDSHLVRIEFDTLRARKEMRLPASSSTLERAANGGVLLVAVRNEVRTLIIPDLRSSRLFRIEGNNRSISSIPGGDQVLLGQDDRILLVDLADPPGREQMPIRESVSVSAPVTAIATSADGTHGLARLLDGRVIPLWLSPLRLQEEPPPPVAIAPTEERVPAPGSPAAEPEERPLEKPEEVEQPGLVPPPATPKAEEPLPPQPVAPREVPTAPSVVPEAASEKPAAEPEPQAPAEERPSVKPEEAPKEPGPGPAAATPKAEEPVRVPAKRTPELPGKPPQAGEPPKPAVEAKPPAPPEERQVRGTLSGPATGLVQAVVLLGPDNLLREAARARPAADGSWSISGLAPGRYWVQLDGGGQKALITDPSFRTVTVEAGKQVTVPEIRVLRAL